MYQITTDAGRNETASSQQAPSRPVFRDTYRFLAEWHLASQDLSPKRRKVLDDLVIQGHTPSMAARTMDITRERVRQLLEDALDAVRQAAADNPQGELAYTRDALSGIAEKVGITTWSFHRMGSATRQTVVQQVTNIKAITPEQTQLVHAACRLTYKPTGKPLHLEPVERSLRRILDLHPGGITPADARQLMENERTIIDSWPKLDLAQFAVARLLAVFTPQGTLRPPDLADKPTKSRIIADLVVQVLQDTGDCLHLEAITEAARNLVRERALDIKYSARTFSNIISQDSRFRWVANSTYGLAKWNVGYSRPENKDGRRIGIKDEIMFLLEQNQTIAFHELMEHINQRFRIAEATVRAAIYTSPHLISKGGLVIKTEHDDQHPMLRSQSVHVINTDTLVSARINMGMSRSELANRSGTNYDAIRRYEIGEQNPLTRRLIDIATALGVNPDDLLRDPADAEFYTIVGLLQTRENE